MESTDLDMGEIFDEDGRDDDDIGAVGTLPDLPDATQSQENDEDNAEVLQRLKDLSKGAAKKVIRRPQPKLDPTRLTGERGIPILPKLGEKMKFKGKGHEAKDLSIIMRCLEHWSHRLFPKMPFDEVIERVEKLGGKKEVQTCVKKIRLDMPILADDFVGSDPEDDDDDVKRGNGDNDGTRREADLDELWDDLLREEEDLRASQAPPPTTSTSQPSTSQPIPGPSEIPSTPITPVQKIATQTPGLTPEQIERIERNKQIAREKKLRKMGIFSPAPVASQSGSVAQSQPSPLSQSGHDKQEMSQSSQNVEENKSIPANQSNQSSSAHTQSEQKGDVKNPDQNCRTQGNKAMDDESEMSEVIGLGTSQNIVLGKGEHRVSAQDQDAKSDQVSSEKGIDMEIEDSESTKETDRIGTSIADTEVHEDDSEEMSAVIDRQDFKQISLEKNIEDSKAMSVIISQQDICENDNAEKQKLVTAGDKSNVEMSEILEKKDKGGNAHTIVQDSGEEDKENLKLDS